MGSVGRQSGLIVILPDDDLEFIAKIKACVTLSTWKGKKNLRAWSWPYFFHCKLRPDMSDTLRALCWKSEETLDINEVVFCCKLCYDKPTSTLLDGLKTPSQNTNEMHTSNHKRHLKTKHKNFYHNLVRTGVVPPPDEGKRNQKKAIDKAIKTKKARLQRNSVVVVKKRSSGKKGDNDGVSVLDAESQTIPAMFQNAMAHLKAGPSLPSQHELATKKYHMEVLEKQHLLEFKCANSHNIANRVVTEFKNCPEWRNMIEHAIENANILKKFSLPKSADLREQNYAA
jgi:hypothetical protein